VSKFLEPKVGSGFAFLLFMALVAVYAFATHAPFVEVAAAWGVGLTFHQGQRAYTQVQLAKNAPCPTENGAKQI
jgi:hypothetical protein